MDFLRWQGASGRTYEFSLHPLHSPFIAAPACYILARLNREGNWEAIYIGETADLSRRLDQHQAAECISHHGATHICVRTTGMSSIHERASVMWDLTNIHRPPCNR